ncbi:MAG: chromosome segregation ATPase [Halioglobus sp.]|jgi:chromosome segregation ATPase
MNDSPKTPRDLRKKLKRAEDSRDGWKSKQADKQYELKIIKSKLHSALGSRDNWKTISRNNESEIAELKHQVDKQDKKIQKYRIQTNRLAIENEELKKNASTSINELELIKNS